MIEAALRAGIPYVDVAAEIEANLDTFTHFTERARAAGVAVVPAMAFFGGLGDLLATDGDGRLDGGRRGARRVRAEQLAPDRPGRVAAGAVSRRAARRPPGPLHRRPAGVPRRRTTLPSLEWHFPAPLGRRTVLGEFTMADVVTVPSHLAIPEVRTYMTAEAARDLAADTPAPAAVDERGRSAQTFTVDVVVRSRRRATARRGQRPGHLRRQRAAGRGGGRPHPRPVGRGRAASPPPARSSTRPTSSARCRRRSPSNRSAPTKIGRELVTQNA